VLHRGPSRTAWRAARTGRPADLTRRAVARIYTGTRRQHALHPAVPPKVAALEAVRTIGSRDAGTEQSADRPGPLHGCFAHGGGVISALGLVARLGGGRVRHQRRHALAGTIAVGVSARNAEREAVEVGAARARDAPAEPLIDARKETGEPVGAVGAGFAGHTAVDTSAALAGKARNAVVGVVATGLGAQTPTDAWVALVRGLAAVLVHVAGSAPGDEAAREVVATGGQTDLADPAWGVVVAEGSRVRARRTEHAGVTP